MSPLRSRRSWWSDSGAALVELAFALPVLIVLMIGVIDLARVFYMAMELQNGARAGAQYGASNAAYSGDTAGMQARAQNAGNVSGVTATASRTCQCADGSGNFSATSGTPNDCTSPTATSCPSGHLVVTVTVTTRKTFTLLSAYPFPISSIGVTRTATLRVPN
jgi:Flp pilus assembly protein TadG